MSAPTPEIQRLASVKTVIDYPKDSPVLPNATPLMRLYSHYRYRQLTRHDIPAVQQRQLFGLLRKARDTRFGRHHHFADIHSIEDFQQAVPLRDYDAHWEAFWEADYPNLVDCTWPGKISYFGTSNGTTAGRIKYIPVSREMVRSNKRASFDLFCHHLQQNPHSALLAGKGMMPGIFVSPAELAPGVYAAFLPNILMSRAMPPWVRPWYFTGSDRLRTLAASEDKMRHLAQESLCHDIRAISSMPHLLLAFFEALREVRPLDGEFRLQDYFPRMEMLVHGGVSVAPYERILQTALEGGTCDRREIYPSTEGFVAIADRGPGEGLRLLYDHGIFYEFIRLDELHLEQPQSHWLGTVEEGVDYSIVLSTCAGLWRYPLGDVVRFSSLRPPRLHITGRTAQTLSVAGEKLMEFDFNRALRAGTETTGLVITEFTVGARMPGALGEDGRHCYVIEFQRPPDSPEEAQRFLEVVNDTLLQNSVIYRNSWQRGRSIAAPELHIAPPGAFRAWLRQQGKEEGKIPRVLPDAARFEALLNFIHNWRA